ncbi:MAG: hypothetical protein ACTSRC_20935 [Candidatus Helarchaeota archaeon]
MSNSNLQALQNVSSSALKENFERLKNSFKANRWLKRNNRYAKKTIDHIRRDVSTQRSNHKNKDINEYIAASILLHSLDAWSYFGRAINSLLFGNIFIAKHLLYYSELRSGMSILAAQGIGVFNNIHFYIKSKERCSPLRGVGGTHKFVWKALDHWIKNLNATEEVLKIIKLENISLDTWINNFGLNPGMKEKITQKWLGSIGFDLQLFEKDRNARNEVSYRPTTINELFNLDYKNVLNEVLFCWNLCEPKSNYGLPKIDEIIISEFFYNFFKQTTNRSIRQAIRNFKNNLWLFFNSIGISDERKRYWVDMISNGQHINRVKKIFAYIKLTETKNINFFLGMLYRALFLLRISVAFCRELIESSDISKDDLEFWWSQIGYNYGLWNDHNSIENFSDLWNDIYEELEKISPIIYRSNRLLQYDIHNNSNISLAKLSSFERVHLWSIGL